MVIAAEQYAARIALPASQRTYRTRWGSRKDLASKALRKLAGPHLPASLKALERAVERAHKHAQDAQDAQRNSASEPAVDVEPAADEQPGGELVEEDLDDVEFEDSGEPDEPTTAAG